MPLLDPHDVHTSDKFREYVETLELGRESILADTPAKVRLALIILDNAAEVFMHRLVTRLFATDEFHSKILPARFSKQLRSQVQWKYPDKVQFLNDEGIVSDEDALLLIAARTHRNQAVHHDAHNPRAGRAIASLLLPVAGKLLQQCVGGVWIGLGGSDKSEWLTTYDLPTSSIDFNNATSVIIGRLSEGLPSSLSQVREALVLDVTTRVSSLEEIRRENLHDPSAAHFDDILRNEEFLAQFDEQAKFPKYFKLLYTVAEGGDVDVVEYKMERAKYEEGRREMLRQFPLNLTEARFSQLVEFKTQLAQAKTHRELIDLYQRSDEALQAYETTITSAAIRIEGTIQMHVDLARGK